MRRRIIYGLVTGLLLLLLGGTCAKERTHRLQLENQTKILLELNDSTKARIARLTTERDSLAALHDAAKTLGGKVVGGVKIVVKEDTLTRPAGPVETEMKEESRIAQVSDTLQGYRVTITAEAPPYPEDLRIGYTIETPPFTPEVGFVQVGDDYYAVVSWAGQSFKPEHAFFRPPRERRFGIYVGGNVGGTPTANMLGVRPMGKIFGELEYRASMPVALQVGYSDQGPYVGVEIKKRIF